jgi:hypothetical protein
MSENGERTASESESRSAHGPAHRRISSARAQKDPREDDDEETFLLVFVCANEASSSINIGRQSAAANETTDKL